MIRYKKGHTNQLQIIKSRNSLHIYNQLFSNKVAQNTQWRKNSLCTKQCWEKLMATGRRIS